MKFLAKLKICNWSLLIASVMMLASSIQLEATRSRSALFVGIHVFIGLIFCVLVLSHVYLHFKVSNWFLKFNKLKKTVTRILWYIFLLTIILGLATLIHWLITDNHSPLGGIHGKFGLLMFAVAIVHIVKRLYFFKNNRANKLP